MDTTTAELQLFEAISKLAGALREGGDIGEIQRDLPAETISLLRDNGFFRIWIPRALGGMELHPTAAARVFEELAKIDSAAAWSVSNSTVVASFFQIFSDAGIAEMFTEPDTIFGGGWFPPGTAVAVEGGYRLSGQGAFNSVCRHADWQSGMAVIVDANGQPQLAPDGTPLLLIAAVPTHEVEIVDHWDTLGMRGTGSHDVRLSEVFVPARRAFVVGPWTSPASAFSGPLYKFHMFLGGAEIAAVALGVAQAALETFTALAQQKTPSYTAQALRDRGVAQDHVARAAAFIGSGRAYLHRSLDDAFEHFENGGAADPLTLMPVQLASCHAVESATRAVDLLQEVAGTSGIRAENGLERHFRDVHTIAQHTLSSAARYESVGQLILRKESDWMFFYL